MFILVSKANRVDPAATWTICRKHSFFESPICCGGVGPRKTRRHCPGVTLVASRIREDIVSAFPSHFRYPVLKPVSVGLQKAQSLCTKLMGVNLLSVQRKKGANHGVKNSLGPTCGFGRIHIYVPVHLPCRIPRLQSVHPVDIPYTKLYSVTVRVDVK